MEICTRATVRDYLRLRVGNTNTVAPLPAKEYNSHIHTSTDHTQAL